MANKVHIVFLVLVTLISISDLLAQENIRFDKIELPDYITNKWMENIFQDRKGYIWFTNGDGLNRYDGYELKTFGLSSEIWGRVAFHYAAEDKDGFIWAGSPHVGIFRFNPSFEKFEFFNHDTTDNNKRIWNLYSDRDGFLWIISDVGLYSFKPPARGERLENVNVLKYVHNPQDSTSLSTNGVNTIFQDKQKKYWIGTRTNGIDILYKRVPDGKFLHYPFSPDHNSVAGNNIQEIFEDYDGNIWIGTQNSGMSIVVNDSLSDNIYFTNYKHNDSPYSLLSNTIFKIVQTKDGAIWITTGSDLQKVNYKNNDFNNLKFNTHTSCLNSPFFYEHNEMCPDRDGRLWISKYGTGIFVYDPAKYQFHHYKIPDSRIGKNDIVSFFEMPGSKGRKVWVSTSAGLYLFNRDNNEFTYVDSPQTKNELTNIIIRFYQSRYSNHIWVGCKNFDVLPDTTILNPVFSGFKRFDPNTGKTTVLNENAKTMLSYDNDGTFKTYPVTDVNDIEEISEKYIVLATNFGIALYDQEENKYIQKPKGTLTKLTSINGGIIDLMYDSKGNLWISLMIKQRDRGVFRFDPRSGELRNFLYHNSEKKTNRIFKIFEDSKGEIWFSAAWLGLWKYTYERDSMIFYDLPKAKYRTLWVKDMLEDDNNNLWLSGEYLTKFNVENESYWIYKEEDGLQGDNFEQWAAYKSPFTGEIYFGGLNGFNIFHSDSIKVSTYISPVLITDFELMNKPSVLADFREKEQILPCESIESIILDYDQNFLSFKFAALDYTNPSNNQYLYKLDGLDKDWIRSYDRKATYTNLDPGKYIFRVKGSNHDGIWNKKKTLLKITILPPWWQTTYAYLIYAFIFITIFYLTWRMQLKRIKVKHEYEMSKFETEKLHEVDELKSRFFTNISHEFRTPLTLILGPIKQLIETITDTRTSIDGRRVRNELKIVHKNANNLLGLVNQLLDISKLESGNMKLHASRQNIIPLLKALLQYFCSYAERKRINLKFSSTANEIIAFIDKEKFEKIITNILSNAFKFTPERGEIEVAVKPTTKSPPKEGTFVEISIRDTGTGIPKKKISKIFDRFYQVDGSHTREQEGTGIGLSLTKELVELHKGNIEVKSEEGKGTTFIIRFPLGREHLKSEEILEAKIDETQNVTQESINLKEDDIVLPITKEKPDLDLVSDVSSNKQRKPILLIVEDNSDVRSYIKDNLDKNYKVIEAIDGEDGWNKSLDPMPDLIISDVMMPKMDGFKLCEKLKTDERTSHIPIILLTAKASSKDKVEGFETGADEYIMKPFDTEELRARIKNLIEQRRRVHDYFKKRGIVELNQSNITSIDKKFLLRATKIIIDNISNASFNIELFSEHLGVSKSLLHKKIVSLTGESPGELIRTIRLKKAVELIKNKFGNISEIALEVGFNNPAYFSDCFKRHFGISPSQYHNNYTR